jgi:Ni/Co efflux regulator RcnB
MKKVFISVLLSAAVFAPAYAQERDWHNGTNRSAPAPAPQPRAAMPAPAPQQRPAPVMPNAGGNGPMRGWQGYQGAGFARGQQQQQVPQPAPQANWNRGFRGQPTQPAFVQGTNPAPQGFRQGWQGQPNGQPQVGRNDPRVSGAAAVQAGQAPFARNDPRFAPGGDRRAADGDRGQWNRGGDNHGQWNGDRRAEDREHGQWNREWRRDDRYNWQAYRQYNRDFFHVGAYYNPFGYGFGYQSFGIGFYLDAPFYANDYWINDPYDYRLPEAYGNTRWVRYYNDVVLVDIDTGEVLDVIHNFFW